MKVSPLTIPQLASFAVDWNRLTDLGAGSPVQSVESQLDALTPEALVAPARLADRRMGEACLAGLCLHYDFLDRSHEISQSLHTVEGSYWHAIMHRREGDFENAKYWFRRAGDHPIQRPLAAEAARLAAAHPADPAAAFLRNAAAWDPFGFVDLCRACETGRADCVDLCKAVQRGEWQLLFTYCLSKARGEVG